MVKNTKDISKIQSLCTGCGTCYGICPRAAITMRLDARKGVYEFGIDRDKCTNCGLCYDCCPGHTVSIMPKDFSPIGRFVECYSGHAANEDVRYNSSSGGLVTALLAYLVESKEIDGALVVRMSEGNPLEPEAFIARTVEELIGASGSKYCPVPANTALKEIMEADGQYAVVGLPCHLHGVRLAENHIGKLRDRITLHLALICGMVPSFKATQFTLKNKIGVNPEDVAEIRYRGNGYPGGMTITLSSGETKYVPLSSYYRHEHKCLRCTLCPDTFGNLSDISFGDAWLPEFAGDKKGTTIAVSRNERGNDVLRKAYRHGAIVLDNISSEKTYLSQKNVDALKSRADIRSALRRMIGLKYPQISSMRNPSSRELFNEVMFYVKKYAKRTMLDLAPWSFSLAHRLAGRNR